MEFTLFLSDWILLWSWDLISAVSDNMVLPNWVNSITCGLKVTHFRVATQSIHHPFPQPFCFQDQDRLVVHEHLPTCHLSEADKSVGPVSTPFTCAASAVTVFTAEAMRVGFEHCLLVPSPASTNLLSLRFLWIPLGHMENFCLLYPTARWPWRNGKLPQDFR